MLQYLRLRGAPAFDPATGTDIGPLKQINFFFGPNGSGKTTISRALVNPTQFTGTTLEWSSASNMVRVKGPFASSIPTVRTRSSGPRSRVGWMPARHEVELTTIIHEENLRADIPGILAATMFRNGALPTSGTVITKAPSSISRFSAGGSGEMKQRVVQKHSTFFEHFFCLSARDDV